MSVLRSVCETNTEALRAIRDLHCPDGFACDATYGNGAFWKELPAPPLLFDVQPLAARVRQADSRRLPLADGSLANMVFDPPFLTYITGGRAHKAGAVAVSARFGGYYTYAELTDHYRGTLREAARVLARRGILVFKCQDIVHNHRLHATHVNVVTWAAEFGFRLRDLFVLTAKHRMPSPQKGKQRHARIFHSYFLVLENK